MLAHLPSLTALNVQSSPTLTMLPTTLRTLKLGATYLVWVHEAEARGQPTFLSTHFPRLTTLAISSNACEYDDTQPLPHLKRFLTAHCTQITSLRGGAAPART